MKKKALFFILLLSLNNIASAQTKKYGNDKDAEFVVRTVVSNLSKNAYSSRFNLEYFNAADSSTVSKIGNVDLKGRLFHIEIEDTEIKFDGKTQWNYVASDNEVTITQPSESDLRESNPMSMIEATLKSNRIVFNEKKQINGYYVVLCYPNSPKSVEYFKITLYINVKTLLPKKIVINQRNSDKISMSFLDLRTTKYVPKLFIFNKAEYPNVNINDLR